MADITLKDLLHSMGYHFGRTRIIGLINDEYARRSVTTFIKQYSNALQLQAAGSHISVYTDESYVHTSHGRNLT